MISREFSNFIGVDVSKDKIDVFSSLDKKRFTVANDRELISRAFKKFDNSNTYVVLENTGGYERKCVDALIGLNFTIHRTDNRKAKNFMRSLGDAKTDALDAKNLALYGEERHEKLGKYEKPSESQEKLRELSLYLDELKSRRAAEKNRLQSPGCRDIKSFVTKSIEDLNKQIESVEKALREIVKEKKELQDKVELLCKYKGVGPVTSLCLISLAPELGKLSRREIAALAGLAPRANDSGKKRGYRKTVGGRQILKKTLFIIALSRVKYKGEIKDYYESLKARGKKKMVAMVACMRKIITKLNAILRDGKIIQKYP